LIIAPFNWSLKICAIVNFSGQNPFHEPQIHPHGDIFHISFEQHEKYLNNFHQKLMKSLWLCGKKWINFRSPNNMESNHFINIYQRSKKDIKSGLKTDDFPFYLLAFCLSNIYTFLFVVNVVHRRESSFQK
jgi:hypothetical protein